jgi:ADP-ribose pyrophosphatase
MRIVSSETKYGNSLFQVTEDVARDRQGFEIRRAVVRHPGSATILMADARKRILLVKQYRMPAGKYVWEIPAGKIDAGESPLQAAKREMKEETGFRARQWTKLAGFWASPGFLAERMTIYLAEDLMEGEAQPTEDERLELRWFTTAEVEKLIDEQKLDDGKTLIAYLLWRRAKRAASRSPRRGG